jgi:hypothetical protein
MLFSYSRYKQTSVVQESLNEADFFLLFTGPFDEHHRHPPTRAIPLPRTQPLVRRGKRYAQKSKTGTTKYVKKPSINQLIYQLPPF